MWMLLPSLCGFFLYNREEMWKKDIKIITCICEIVCMQHGRVFVFYWFQCWLVVLIIVCCWLMFRVVKERHVFMFRTHSTLVSHRRPISTQPLLPHHSRQCVQAAPVAVRHHPARLTCYEHWACKLTSHCNGPLCRRCALEAWLRAELPGMDHRRCTTTSAWVQTCLRLGRGLRWTRCVPLVHLIHTPLNVLPSCTAMLPVSTSSSLFVFVDRCALYDTFISVNIC